MKQIVMDKARLIGYKGKVKGTSHSLAIEVAARLTAKIAEALNVRWVLMDKAELPKEGYSEIKLDAEIKGCKLRYEIKGLEQHALELQPDSICKFVVKKTGSKKKGAGLFLRFEISYVGNAHDLIDTFERLGSSDGVMTLTALQQDLLEQVNVDVNGKRVNGAGMRQTALTAVANASNPRTANNVQ